MPETWLAAGCCVSGERPSWLLLVLPREVHKCPPALRGRSDQLHRPPGLWAQCDLGLWVPGPWDTPAPGRGLSGKMMPLHKTLKIPEAAQLSQRCVALVLRTEAPILLCLFPGLLHLQPMPAALSPSSHNRLASGWHQWAVAEPRTLEPLRSSWLCPQRELQVLVDSFWWPLIQRDESWLPLLSSSGD